MDRVRPWVVGALIVWAGVGCRQEVVLGTVDPVTVTDPVMQEMDAAMPLPMPVCACDADVNGDDRVDIRDLTFIQGCIADFTGAEDCALTDLDCDGFVDDRDIDIQQCQFLGLADCCTPEPEATET